VIDARMEFFARMGGSKTLAFSTKFRRCAIDGPNFATIMQGYRYYARALVNTIGTITNKLLVAAQGAEGLIPNPTSGFATDSRSPPIANVHMMIILRGLPR